jgi:AmiR/NasT family two-component response regulator
VTYASCKIFTVDRVDGGLADERLSILVNQATGMVAVQLDCDVIEAFDQLQRRALATGESLEHLALDVIDGVTRFDR